MIERIQISARSWVTRNKAPSTIKVFRKALLLFTLTYTLWLIPVADRLFGPGSLILPHEATGIDVFNLLHYPGLREHYKLFIGMQLLAILLRLLGKGEKLMDIAIYFFTANLFNGMYMATNGGHRLLLIFLFLLIFADEDIPVEQGDGYAKTGRVLTNGVFWLLQIQVAIVYFISGISKLYGTHWLDGSALEFVLSIPEFTLPWIAEKVAGNGMAQFATYVALAYQLLFPVLVWFRKVKGPLLTIGVIMHLSITFVMGLVDFGLIMIIAYLPFLSDLQASKTLVGIRRFVR